MSNITENTNKLLNFISEKFQKGEINNESLVKLIELSGGFLNLQTIPDYAKAKGISYVGAKKETKQRKIVELFGIKLVIDNF